jgi:DNA-directed RNA polymerase subunit RPC12/RpoP
MNMPEPVDDDEIFDCTPPDFRFSLRFDDGPVRFLHGELEASCPLCGARVMRCYWRRLELFYESEGAAPQIVCEACGRRHAAQLKATRDAYRRHVDPLQHFDRDAQDAYVRYYIAECQADQAAAERVASWSHRDEPDEH